MSLRALNTACLSPVEASPGFTQKTLSSLPWVPAPWFLLPCGCLFHPLNAGASWGSVLGPLSFPFNIHEPSQMTHLSSLSPAPHYAINSPTPISVSDPSRALHHILPLDRGIPQEPQAQELRIKCIFFPSPARPGPSMPPTKRWSCFPPIT